jgi:L-ascorbate metabolism protein UlaG (beta-lactamase superfamily)
MQITYHGHACFELKWDEYNLLVDPFISGNPLASGIDIDQLNPSHILLTHGHADHVLDAESIANRSGAQIISNYEIATWYEAKGISAHGMNHGGSFEFAFGRLKYVQAVHSSVLPDGTYGGNPGGFVVEAAGACIYLAGDTALTYDMKLLAEQFELDLAVLPLGDNFTMGYRDAVIAAQWVAAKSVIGCHYNTFPPIEIDLDAAREVFAEKEIPLLLPQIGESLSLS